MPRRDDIHKILILGSGPIVIGQAAEFDYSGVQACKVLREEGYEVVLVNSNPATIMTDPEFAEATYIEPLLPGPVTQVIERERPDALLGTLGGQTALNLAKALHDDGTLERFGVELIGANYEAIACAEDRELFGEAMAEAGLRMPKSAIATSLEQALDARRGDRPAVHRAPGLHARRARRRHRAHRRRTSRGSSPRGIEASPIGQVLLDESVIGWGEFELEVMRDRADNVVIVCSIENVDPMGVHTGDSVTVAPQQTLTDDLYQRLRDQAIAVIRAVGVETGGSNVQFAVNPETEEILVIEMNPRVSRSSALASKATGFPIAKIAARLAVGYLLEEIDNDITGVTPACFEPTIDYVVVKWPRFAFEKFPGADSTLTTHMKSVGETMAFGRTFQQAFAKALRSRELDKPPAARRRRRRTSCSQRLEIPCPDRYEVVLELLARGVERRGGARADAHRPVVPAPSCARWRSTPRRRSPASARSCPSTPAPASSPRARPTTTPAGSAPSPGGAPRGAPRRRERPATASRPERSSIVILGSGPNRIGQGIEFDYCCVHAAMTVRDSGCDAVMINCNPETVSTDYDTSDRLYFEPLTLQDVLAVVEVEKPRGLILQFGGQTPLKLAAGLEAPACRCSARACRRSTSPRTAGASARCWPSSATKRRPTRPRARSRRRWTAPSRSASRCSCARPTCSAAAQSKRVTKQQSPGRSARLSGLASQPITVEVEFRPISRIGVRNAGPSVGASLTAILIRRIGQCRWRGLDLDTGGKHNGSRCTCSPAPPLAIAVTATILGNAQRAGRCLEQRHELCPPVGGGCCRCIGFGAERRHDVVQIVGAGGSGIRHIVIEKHGAEIEVAGVEIVNARDHVVAAGAEGVEDDGDVVAAGQVGIQQVAAAVSRAVISPHEGKVVVADSGRCELIGPGVVADVDRRVVIASSAGEGVSAVRKGELANAVTRGCVGAIAESDRDVSQARSGSRRVAHRREQVVTVDGDLEIQTVGRREARRAHRRSADTQCEDAQPGETSCLHPHLLNVSDRTADGCRRVVHT